MKILKKTLVTGGAGFIGSHLCDELILRDYEVFCLDNLITGRRENIVHLERNPRFHFINHDIIKPLSSTLDSSLVPLALIYHLASPASPVKYRKYSIETLLVNSSGTINMLQLAVKRKAIFMLASTSEVYGDPKQHPQREAYFGNVNPVGERACYDESKRFAEAATAEFARKFNLQTIIVRIFNTYGPRMSRSDGRVVSNFITQALKGKPLTLYGDGKQTRSFCFIKDMVKGIISASEKKRARSQVINLGNPEEVTIRQLGNIIIKLTQSSSKLISVMDKPKDDPVRRKPDISLAYKLFLWQPEVGLEAGLKKTIDYFKKI